MDKKNGHAAPQETPIRLANEEQIVIENKKCECQTFDEK